MKAGKSGRENSLSECEKKQQFCALALSLDLSLAFSKFQVQLGEEFSYFSKVDSIFSDLVCVGCGRVSGGVWQVGRNWL